MKTAISLPDEVFDEADRLARRLKKTRSALYREAVLEYLGRHDPEAMTVAMNRVIESVGPKPDSFSRAAARRALGKVEW